MMPRPTPRDNAGELGATPWKPSSGRMAPAPPPAPRASQVGVRRRLAVVVWPSQSGRRAHAKALASSLDEPRPQRQQRTGAFPAVALDFAVTGPIAQLVRAVDSSEGALSSQGGR